MPVLDDLSLLVDVAADVDAILRAQGADPGRLRARGSGALAVAKQALEEGVPLLAPAVVYERVAAIAFRHRRLLLEGGGGRHLSGTLIAAHLHSVSDVFAIVCTIGPLLEQRSAAWMGTDAPRALALDALGSVAVERLATLAGGVLEELAAAEGLCVTLPLSPGLIGWPLQSGQRELFALVDAGSIGVTLSPSAMMTPHKSRSLVLGVGPHVIRVGEVCDYCDMRERCRHRPAA